MIKIIFIYFTFNVLFLSSQIKNGGLGSAPTVQNMVTTLQHDTCLNKKFSIVFYVVLDSLSPPTPGFATPANLNILVNDLNTVFKRICVQFLNCSTVYIPNHPFNVWSKNIVDPIVTSNWHTDKTICVYLADVLSGLPPNELLGYTYPPTATAATATDVIVLTKGSLQSVNSAGFQNDVAIHQFGHYFGLPNTFDEINLTPAVPPPPAGAISNEFFNRSNCYIHGDGFCDTEADPYPLGIPPPFVTVPCGYLTGPQDGNTEYYVPPLDNLMSNYGCRCRFSQEQYNFMAHIMITKRFYLH
ncbi:MAG: hypothetical protein H0U95_05900 [Bacteroidetes bacterium]|nr:hypothetical protein [Bacteroidota bacterium]